MFGVNLILRSVGLIIENFLMKFIVKLFSCFWECEDFEIEIKRRGNFKIVFNLLILLMNGFILIFFNVNFI